MNQSVDIIEAGVASTPQLDLEYSRYDSYEDENARELGSGLRDSVRIWTLPRFPRYKPFPSPFEPHFQVLVLLRPRRYLGNAAKPGSESSSNPMQYYITSCTVGLDDRQEQFLEISYQDGERSRAEFTPLAKRCYPV